MKIKEYSNNTNCWKISPEFGHPKNKLLGLSLGSGLHSTCLREKISNLWYEINQRRRRNGKATKVWSFFWIKDGLTLAHPHTRTCSYVCPYLSFQRIEMPIWWPTLVILSLSFTHAHAPTRTRGCTFFSSQRFEIPIQWLSIYHNSFILLSLNWHWIFYFLQL